MMTLDLIIKNGKIIDGTGNTWYYGDIGIKNGKIEKISHNIVDSEARIIDANHLIVCPGFIDIHSHTDYILPFNGKVESSIKQGITTQVVGMCGDGLAPLPKDKQEDFKGYLKSLNPIFSEIKINWHTYEEYLNEMEKVRCPANSVFFVGYNNLRIAGGQGFEDRSATAKEMEEMKAYLKEAMQAGAFGMSTGLIYDPQVFVSTEELIELTKIVARYGGLYFSHIRGEGKTLIKAVNEFIEIVEKSHVMGGQIAHHKVAGKTYWGKSIESLRLIEQANERGISISFDSYPYLRGMTSLKAALPPKFREGGDEQTLRRLREPEIRATIKNVIEDVDEGWENFIKENGFENIFVYFVNNGDWKDILGKNLKEITEIKKFNNEWDTFFNLLIEDDLCTGITIQSMNNEDVIRIIKNKYQMFGTDGVGIPINPRLPKFHPRCFGMYPKIFRKCVREKKILSIEEAVRKMTSFPAQRLGLTDRGVLKEGMGADIVIFDPIKIKDKSTYEEPHQESEGIFYVIVNGVICVQEALQKKKTPGNIIRHLI
jgi:N-acyl-D-amino-acid deacylase